MTDTMRRLMTARKADMRAVPCEHDPDPKRWQRGCVRALAPLHEQRKIRAGAKTADWPRASTNAW